MPYRPTYVRVVCRRQIIYPLRDTPLAVIRQPAKGGSAELRRITQHKTEPTSWSLETWDYQNNFVLFIISLEDYIGVGGLPCHCRFHYSKFIRLKNVGSLMKGQQFGNPGRLSASEIV